MHAFAWMIAWVFAWAFVCNIMFFRGRGAYACPGPVKRRMVTETTADCERISYEKHRITIYHRGGSWAPTVWTTAITQAMMRTYQKEPFVCAVSIGISVSLSRYFRCTFACVYCARATSSPHKQTYTRTRTRTQAQTHRPTLTHEHTHTQHACAPVHQSRQNRRQFALCPPRQPLASYPLNSPSSRRQSASGGQGKERGRESVESSARERGKIA